MRSVLIAIFTCLSLWSNAQTGGDKMAYTVAYKTVTKKCHYCGKSFGLSAPSKITIKSGTEDDIQMVEITRLFKSKLNNNLIEGEGCTSALNRTSKHVFNEDENKKSESTKTFELSKNEADLYIAWMEPYMKQYEGAIKSVMTMVYNAEVVK